jgi:hypothetical protein
MSKFKKLSRAEIKEVMGGVVHTCAITCQITEGGGVVPYVYYMDACPNPGAACDGIGGYVGCVCV